MQINKRSRIMRKMFKIVMSICREVRENILSIKKEEKNAMEKKKETEKENELWGVNIVSK